MRTCVKKTECSGCGACAEICHAGAIQMIRDKEGFSYPQIDEKICIDCGQCELVCPIKDKNQKGCDNLYLGVKIKDETSRYTSSSGGMFSVLAQYVLEKKGVVYGAAYNERMEVVHTDVWDMRQLEKIKKSKYVQSNMEGVYCTIEEQLRRKQWVLFCGTPCQARALTLFLNESYSTLIIVDLVCYGAASPGVWNAYIRYLGRRHGNKVTQFCFRDKRNRNNGRTCSYVAGGTEYVSELGHNIYCKMYFGNYILRPVCHSCRFCTVDRFSDFTIGDFWNIENIRPEADDGLGTSMVIVHTEKAKVIWERVKEQTFWFECRKEEILQPRLTNPTCAARARKQFMILYKIIPFSLFVKILNGISVIEKVCRRFFKGRI